MKCIICDSTEYLSATPLLDEDGVAVPICNGCLAVLRHLSTCQSKEAFLHPKVTRRTAEDIKGSLANLPDEDLHEILDELES